MSLITQYFPSGGIKSNAIPDVASGTKNSLISQYYPTVSKAPVETVKESSFFEKVKEKLGGFVSSFAPKRVATNVGIGGASVGTSLLDSFQMIAERSEVGKPAPQAKIDSTSLPGFPKLTSSIPSTKTADSPIVNDNLKLIMRKSEPTKISPKSQIFAALSEPVKQWSEEVSPKNPTFMDQLQQGVGSMGGYLLLGAVSGGASAGSMSIIESISEAGSVYSKNRKNGMSVGEASVKADQDLLANIFINYATNKYGGLFDGGKKTFKNIVGSASGEGIQEAFQQLSSNITTNESDVMSGVFESLGVGAILGGGTKLILPSGEEVSIKPKNEIQVVENTGKLSEKENVVQRQSISVRDQYEGAKTALASIKPDGTGSIAIILDEKAQGKGLGTKIVSDLEGKLAERGITTMDIRSFPESVGFWEKQGYKVSGEQSMGVIPMTKTIEAKNTDVSELNRPFNEKNTKAVIEQTKSGQREEFRLDTSDKIAKNASGLENAKPDDTVMVYRAGDGEIGGGEYVTTSKQRAETTYMRQRPGATLLQKEVKIADLVRGDGLKTEFVYSPKQEATTMPTSELSELTGSLKGRSEKPGGVERAMAEIKDGKSPAVRIRKVDGKTVIEDGGHRVEAYKRLGIKDVPVQDVTSEYEPKGAILPTKTNEERLKLVKDEKSVRSTLKDIRKELLALKTEAEGMAIVAQEQRSGINTEDVAKLKRAIATSKTLQEGDIETIRKSKSGKLLDTVLQNVQEVHPEMDEDQAFDFARELPTKADENARTPTIIELEKKEKSLAKLLTQLKEKQKELSIKDSEALTTEWDKALAAQEELINVIKIPSAQMPVGEGKVKVSRLEARTKDVLGEMSQEEIDRLGLTTYNQMNKKENITLASKYVAENTEQALRVIKGEIDPPDGMLKNSIYVALKALGAENTDIALKIASLGSTRMGQEISILSEIDKDSPVSMMEDVVKTRIEAFERKTGRKSSAKIKNEVSKIDAEVKAPSGRQWDSFLKDILC